MKRLAGAVAGAALAGLTTGALAQGGSSGGTGVAPAAGSYGQGGTSTAPGTTTGAHRLEGKVLESSGTTITVLSSGAAIPLDVRPDTRFSGARSANDLKEGDEVRASFELKAGRNELTSVARVSGGEKSGKPGELGTGAGGTGSTSPYGPWTPGGD